MGRRAKTVTRGGVTLTIAEWCARPELVSLGIKPSTLAMRLTSPKWDEERAFTTPLNGRAAGVSMAKPRGPVQVDLGQLQHDVDYIKNEGGQPVRVSSKIRLIGAERYGRVSELARELEVLEMQIVAKRLELIRLLRGG